MSIVLSVLFACFGLVAVLAMLASWKRHRPAIAGLREALRQPPKTIAPPVNLPNRSATIPASEPQRLRHGQQPKPIRNSLPGPKPRGAIA